MEDHVHSRPAASTLRRTPRRLPSWLRWWGFARRSEWSAHSQTLRNEGYEGADLVIIFGVLMIAFGVAIYKMVERMYQAWQRQRGDEEDDGSRGWLQWVMKGKGKGPFSGRGSLARGLPILSAESACRNVTGKMNVRNEMQPISPMPVRALQPMLPRRPWWSRRKMMMFPMR